MAGIFTLGKKERLKGRKAIEELFSKGIRLNQGPFRVVYRPSSQPELRLGVGVSVRHFRKSVDRNRIKRLLREAYRLNKLSLKESLMSKGRGLDLFISYAATDKPDYPTVEKAVKNILNKLLQRINENDTPTT
jgi:ribonuclease P protein component